VRMKQKILKRKKGREENLARGKERSGCTEVKLE
jgi:hypothetical protein